MAIFTAITGVTPPEAGSAEIISTVRGPRLRYVTTDAEPAGQLLRYELADGQGGITTGYAAVRSPATGNFNGTPTDSANPGVPPGLLTVTIGKNNSFSAAFLVAGRRYTGSGKSRRQGIRQLPFGDEGTRPVKPSFQSSARNSAATARDDSRQRRLIRSDLPPVPLDQEIARTPAKPAPR